MVDEQVSPEDQEELEQIANLVAKSLMEGKSQEDTIRQLVDNGWKQETADQFVYSIAAKLADVRNRATQEEAIREKEGGGMNWLVWIGLILFINLLSYLFNWPFWIY